MDKKDLLTALDKELPAKGCAVIVWDLDGLKAGKNESEFTAYLEKPTDELFEMQELHFAEADFYLDNRATSKFRVNLRLQNMVRGQLGMPPAFNYDPDVCFVFLPCQKEKK